MEVAVEERITVALAKEMMDETEMRGEVVRDDVDCVIVESGGGMAGVGEAGVRWWPNVFVGYVWDGQTFDE
jgi:ESCRT-II complex subunit VPS36